MQLTHRLIEKQVMKIKFGIAVFICFQLFGCASNPAEPPQALQKMHDKGTVLINKLLGDYSPANNEPPKVLNETHDKGEVLVKKSRGSNSTSNNK
jgi:hypothetical protein